MRVVQAVLALAFVGFFPALAHAEVTITQAEISFGSLNVDGTAPPGLEVTSVGSGEVRFASQTDGTFAL